MLCLYVHTWLLVSNLLCIYLLIKIILRYFYLTICANRNYCIWKAIFCLGSHYIWMFLRFLLITVLTIASMIYSCHLVKLIFSYWDTRHLYILLNAFKLIFYWHFNNFWLTIIGFHLKHFYSCMYYEILSSFKCQMSAFLRAICIICKLLNIAFFLSLYLLYKMKMIYMQDWSHYVWKLSTPHIYMYQEDMKSELIIPPEQQSCWGVYWFHSVRHQNLTEE